MLCMHQAGLRCIRSGLAELVVSERAGLQRRRIVRLIFLAKDHRPTKRLQALDGRPSQNKSDR